MSEAIIECPPTPEHISNCPTPPVSKKMRIRDFIQKQLMASDTISDNEVDGEENQRDEAGSPPPNCSICLGRINSKCFTDSCLHTFCFNCLLEWSKIKAECPLCKQAFKSIIHNVKSMDNYEEHKVENYRNCSNWATIANHFEQFLLAAQSFPTIRTRMTRQRSAELSVLPNAERTSTSTSTGSNYSRIHQLFLNYNGLVERFAREYANDVIPLRTNGSAWRAYVYQRNLYALPLNDLSGRSRDISARFYRENPAQIHRLIAWLNREVLYLLQSPVHYISYALQTIEEYIIQHDMTSRTFRQLMQPIFGRHTSHFIHELVNFARSPFDIIGYDRNVQYRPHFNDIEIESVSLDSDRSDPSPRLSPRSDLSNMTAEDSYVSNESLRNNHSRSVIVFGGEGSSRIFTTPSSQLFQPISISTEPVTIDTDDSEDCLFVCEQKPPHLRTPVMVELNSDDEDSDVIIVETEVKSENSTNNRQTSSHEVELSVGSTSSIPSVKSESSTNRRHLTTDVVERTIDSNAPNEASSSHSMASRRKRRIQNKEDYTNTTAGPSQIKMIIRSDPHSSYSATITTDALLAESDVRNVTTMSDHNIDHNRPRASTSGYRKSISGRLPKRKYTIYEASSDSTNVESTDSESSHEECQLKSKRLAKRKACWDKILKKKHLNRKLLRIMAKHRGKNQMPPSSSSSSDESSNSSSDIEDKESDVNSSSDNSP